jgi:3-oxoacyl-[acyl-carrier-protein] synthase II
MGEEAAGFDAVRIACARIEAGQSEICLVGGSFNAQRPDAFLHDAMGHMLWRGPFAPAAARQANGGGTILGSAGCFLVIESRAHAVGRGATPKARIAGLRAGRCGRAPGEANALMAGFFNELGGMGAASAVVSGTSGVAQATADELRLLADFGLPFRSITTAIGNTVEPSFPASIAIAAMSVARGRLFPPLEAAEAACDGPIEGLFVTSRGLWRGEAAALVVPA